MRSDGLQSGAVSLVLVIVVTVALTALGLGIAALGTLEAQAARYGLAARQAGFAAESGLRMVKHWFDAPDGAAGAWLVPGPADVDRAARRVDPDGDGTFQAYAGAPAPWNTVYRQGRDDLFARPYRGEPSLSAEGEARGPDVVLAWDSASAAERAFLARAASELFPVPPGPNLALRLVRIAVFGPPCVRTGGGARRRMGMASLEVRAAVVRLSVDGDSEIATASARGVLQEIPYAAPGPLSTAAIEDGTGLDVRWGTVSASGNVNLGPAPSALTAGGWPWVSLGRRLIADANLDGTIDDADADGTADLDEWLGLADATLEDPWLRLLAGGSLAGAPASPQPFPFDPALIPGAYTTDADRSGLFQAVPGALAYVPDAPVYRAAAADGGAHAHLLRYVTGTVPPLFREGAGSPASFEDLTRGKEGLFYFDTLDARPPGDGDGDGTLDNLTPAIAVSDPAWWSRGCIVVNASSFSIGDSSRLDLEPVAPPGEPFADLDGDGTCGAAEPFLRLDYPPDPLAPGAAFTRLGITTPAGGAPPRAGGPALSEPVSFVGVLLLTGRLEGPSSARISGAVVAAGAVHVAPGPGGTRLQILYDARLARGDWPPASWRLPRTVWQRRSVGP